MHVDDMLRDVEVIFIVFLVEDDKEEVEARHDRRRDVHIEA